MNEDGEIEVKAAEQTFVTFGHPVCLQCGIFQQRMVVEEKDFFFVEKLINIFLSGTEEDLIGGLGENPEDCFQPFLLVFPTD